jgi:hypothetical protein
MWPLWEAGEVHAAFCGIPEGKRPLGRPRCRWEYNLTMDIQGVEWGGMSWIAVARIGIDGGLL